jgi:hypothetical protein
MFFVVSMHPSPAPRDVRNISGNPPKARQVPDHPQAMEAFSTDPYRADIAPRLGLRLRYRTGAGARRSDRR